jgi:IclR family acetate operon transcriptional repressor
MGGAVAKSFRVLEAVATARGPVRLSTLAVDLDLQKSTVHRVLSELIDLGYVEQESSSGLYRATLRSWEIGSAVIADLPIKQIASSALHDLHRETGETASLIVRSGDDALYLDKIISPRPIRFTTRVGSRVPLPLPAGGKAILAMSADGDDVVRRTGSRDDLGVPYDVDGVLRSIGKARRAGYTISTGWGITSIAAAIVDRGDLPVAALAVSAPTDRVKGRRDELIEAVVTTATRLSEVASRA